MKFNFHTKKNFNQLNVNVVGSYLYIFSTFFKQKVKPLHQILSQEIQFFIMDMDLLLIIMN